MREGPPSTSLTPDTPTAKRDVREHGREMQRKVLLDQLRLRPQPISLRSNVLDPYENAEKGSVLIEKPTGVAYDPLVVQHKCLYDDNYPENPERYSVPFEKIVSLGLLDRCVQVTGDPHEKTEDFARMVHTPKHLDTLKKFSTLDNVEALEAAAKNYDSVYFNQSTYDASIRSATTLLNLVESCAQGFIKNGFAFTRPPGHHAEKDKYVGYCFLNNVAIAAKQILDKGYGKRVLIVDVDVHHGQATQETFYSDPNVLYFSIHRYEKGAFWPNLEESNYNFIGSGEGKGFNINVPLNVTGLGDVDYMAIVLQLLMPIAYEFAPDYVIVSAGYDAMIGDPEGCMKVTPAFYAHLISHLSVFAEAKVMVALEGGYNIDSLTSGVVYTIRALLGDACPKMEPLGTIHESVIESILNAKACLMPHWYCLNRGEHPLSRVVSDEHQFNYEYVGRKPRAPYPTKSCYPTISKEVAEETKAFLDQFDKAYIQNENNVVLATHPDMLEKPKPYDFSHVPERTDRLSHMTTKFAEYNLNIRMEEIDIRVPNLDRCLFKYCPTLTSIIEQIEQNTFKNNEMKSSEDTYKQIRAALACGINAVEKIMNGEASSGIAMVRPPGHHAEFDKPQGYCFVNNVAAYTSYLLNEHSDSVKKVLIVDFDIHHGNGTQNTFIQSSNVMYVSIHRDDDGKFYPFKSPRTMLTDGIGPSRGYNVNINLCTSPYGNYEYLLGFLKVIVPVSYAFCPDFVIVSAGFDAGINDPVGKGYQLTPEVFGHFIQLLKPLANGRMLVSLEGGYNLETTSVGMAYCAKALLNDPLVLPDLKIEYLKKKVENSLHVFIDVARYLKRYWPFLDTNREMTGVITISSSRFQQSMEPLNSEMVRNRLRSFYVDDLFAKGFGLYRHEKKPGDTAFFCY